MPTPFRDLTETRFGKLTCKWPVGRGVFQGEKRTKYPQTYWLCLCDCGSTNIVSVWSLREGHCRSCGCLRGEWAKSGNSTRRHGHSVGRTISPTYRVWAGMMQRCGNPNNPNYRIYGGAGVSVCEHWHTFDGFLEDMGERPTGKSIGRIKDLGNYEPGNAKWMTWKEQGENQRLKRAERIRP